MPAEHLSYFTIRYYSICFYIMQVLIVLIFAFFYNIIPVHTEEMS